MNAKELADMLRRDADHIESFRGVVKPSYLQAMADVAELLMPKYRPPVPSDHGKWCWIEQLPLHGPQYVKLKASGVYCFDFAGKKEWQQVLKGVWPCERPESTT